jgi:hypothetical protein
MVVGRKQMLHLSDAGEFQQRNKSHTMQHSTVDHIHISFPSLFSLSSFVLFFLVIYPVTLP